MRRFAGTLTIGLLGVAIFLLEPARPASAQETRVGRDGRTYRKQRDRYGRWYWVQAPSQGPVQAAPATPPDRRGQIGWLQDGPGNGPGPASPVVPTSYRAMYRLGVYTDIVTIQGWGPGLRVTALVPYGAAWGRLDPNDVILSVDNRRVWSQQGLVDALQAAGASGGSATLTLRNIRTGMIENHILALQYN